MGRATPPFRADHVGSLLRPRRLLQARDDHAAGRMSEEELRAVEDDAIRDVVAMQRDVGLQSATDGEFRRASWHMDFIYRLGGVSRAPEHLKVQFATQPAPSSSPRRRSRSKARSAWSRPSSARTSRRCRRW
jgi:methionine synthase II (cobalamin-independent)